MNSEIGSIARKLASKLGSDINSATRNFIENAVEQGISIIRAELPDLQQVGIRPFDLKSHPIYCVFGREKARDILKRYSRQELVSLGYVPPVGSGPKARMYLWQVWAFSVMALRPRHNSVQVHQLV